MGLVLELVARNFRFPGRRHFRRFAVGITFLHEELTPTTFTAIGPRAKKAGQIKPQAFPFPAANFRASAIGTHESGAFMFPTLLQIWGE